MTDAVLRDAARLAIRTLSAISPRQGRNPCVIPVGGSNALGTWGYLEAAREMDGQLREAGITDVALVSRLCSPASD